MGSLSHSIHTAPCAFSYVDHRAGARRELANPLLLLYWGVAKRLEDSPLIVNALLRHFPGVLRALRIWRRDS